MNGVFLLNLRDAMLSRMLAVAQNGRKMTEEPCVPWLGVCWLSGDDGYGAGTTAAGWQLPPIYSARDTFPLAMKKMGREGAANGSRWDRHPGRCRLPVNKVQKENQRKSRHPARIFDD